MNMRSVIKIIILSIIFGAISGALVAFIVLNPQAPNENELIKDFYLTENAVHVSPHHIRKALDEGNSDFILVDLRSEEEYKEEHIVTAISIPAYRDKDTSAYSDTKRIIEEFSKLPKDKDIIVYCYSTPCMTGRKIGKLLAENDIYVKHLGIGWNEWRYFWNQWNHEHEWEITNVEDYIASGEEPGTSKIKTDSNACPIDGELGC